MNVKRGGFLSVILLAILTLGGAVVANPDAALSTVAEQLRWSGTVDGALTTHPADCSEACDEFTFEVSLPQGTWSREGGVQIGIRWGDEGDDLDLSVYDAAGEEVARSHGTASTAESVLLPQVRNGSYRAVVFSRAEQLIEGRFEPDVTDEAVEYEGLVEVEWRPRLNPMRDLLPNLVSLPARNLVFSTGAYLFDPGLSLGGCYPEEIVEKGARRCLRFDQIIGNDGEGPLELRFRMDGIATDQPLMQRIYLSDGSYRDRVADRYEFHATHGHFHYENFGRSRLWLSNAQGERLGVEPVVTGDKVGFCPIDIENFAFGQKGDAARAYYFERCNNPTESDVTGTYMVTGISPGWVDVYNWFLADQYIEVSGVPDGYYLLESIADPADTVIEANESDNAVEVLIRLCGEQVDLIGATDRCGASR